MSLKNLFSRVIFFLAVSSPLFASKAWPIDFAEFAAWQFCTLKNNSEVSSSVHPADRLAQRRRAWGQFLQNLENFDSFRFVALPGESSLCALRVQAPLREADFYRSAMLVLDGVSSASPWRVKSQTRPEMRREVTVAISEEWTVAFTEPPPDPELPDHLRAGRSEFYAAKWRDAMSEVRQKFFLDSSESF